MDPITEFQNQIITGVNVMSADLEFLDVSSKWLELAHKHKYSYNFGILGRPIIQYPQDIVTLQEIIWKVKPDLIIETGIAHGGSLILSAALLALLDLETSVNENSNYPMSNPTRKVIGIDIDFRKHNREELSKHFLSNRIEIVDGSSISNEVVDKVKRISEHYNNVMVLLDSNHTHEHVLEELRKYSELVSVDNYCIVYDTIIESLPNSDFTDRPWKVGNNPRTAVDEFLRSNGNFENDSFYENRSLITVAPGGFLKRIH